MTKLFTVRLLVLIGMLSLTACASQHPMHAAREHFDQQNYAMAYDELLTLAKRGNVDAQYAVGYMTYYGMGTAKDESIARRWIRSAAKQGHPDALIAYKMLAQDNQGGDVALDFVPSEYAPPTHNRTPNPVLQWFKQTMKKKELV